MFLEESAAQFLKQVTVATGMFSPFMSPKLHGHIASRFESIAHLDGSARIQTVSEADDSWSFELLDHVCSRTGFGILANNSFNTRGRPLVNTAQDALTILREHSELDFVLIEDWLF